MNRLTRTGFLALAAIGLILVVAALYLFAPAKFIEALSVWASLASIFSLVLVIVQLSAVREATELTQTAAADTRIRLLAFLTAMDIAKNLKTIQEIQFYNRTGKFELSVIRMQELRSGLTDILNNERLKDHIKPNLISRQISEISVNLNSLEKELHSPSNSLDVVGLNQFLESVAYALDILHSKTKHEGITL